MPRTNGAVAVGDCLPVGVAVLPGGGVLVVDGMIAADALARATPPAL